MIGSVIRQQRRVTLVLDWDDLARERARRALRRAGHRVLAARDWSQAAALLVRERVDTLVVDTQRPGVCPWSITRLLRNLGPDAPDLVVWSDLPPRLLEARRVELGARVGVEKCAGADALPWALEDHGGLPVAEAVLASSPETSLGLSA